MASIEDYESMVIYQTTPPNPLLVRGGIGKIPFLQVGEQDKIPLLVRGGIRKIPFLQVGE